MKLESIQNKMIDNEKYLSEFATKSNKAIRLKEDDDKSDIRPAFFRDTDRIIHSLSYTRYIGKTQVFSFKSNDNISKRMVHVQLVSKVARTIGRALGLNEDLIEAMALGHDVGHTPLGHAGEAMLNKISLEYLGEMFNHNIQSVREYLNLENNGRGSNLTIQTLDGIMCHNGEMLNNIYEPVKKTKEQFIEEYNKCYTDKNILKSVKPMTLEGCVVRISDVIAYIGRDIEDAINVGLIKRTDVPKNISKVLGNTNKDIVNKIILDIIENSINKPYIKLSEDVYNALFELKDFNYKNIYSKANSKEMLEYFEKGMNNIFVKYLDDLKNKNKESDIYKVFVDKMDKEYLENTKSERIVIDYIAGMTDQYLEEMIKKYK